MAMALTQLLPRDFSEWYPKDTLIPGETTDMGRPKFTQRDLVDWGLNDLRSLLIIDELPVSWNGEIPDVSEQTQELAKVPGGLRIVHLPRHLADYDIAQILASTDLYKEHGLDYEFKLQTAMYTLDATHKRRREMSPTPPLQGLTKHEWRNVIENYLLNLACEAQCRLDYKRACHVCKKQKKQQQKQSNNHGGAFSMYDMGSSLSSITEEPAAVPSTSPTSTSPLLRQAILTSLSTSPNVPEHLKNRILNAQRKKTSSLTIQEKQQLWVNVQTALYSRLGLDWQPDQFN